MTNIKSKKAEKIVSNGMSFMSIFKNAYEDIEKVDNSDVIFVDSKGEMGYKEVPFRNH